MGDEAECNFELHQLQKTVHEQRHVLQDGQITAASQAWLRPQLDTPEGTRTIYSLMERMVATPQFLFKLTNASKESLPAGCAKAQEEGIDRPPDVTHADFWEDGSLSPEEPQDLGGQRFEEISKEDRQASAEPLDSYVLVEKEDVLEAIGTFVAAYLVTLPEAQKLKPEELQKAVARSLQDLQQSRMRRLWGWGRCIYRCIAFSYGAFSVYENPWLVRALLAAIWTASKLMFGLLV